jgi:hypothetical protein
LSCQSGPAWARRSCDSESLSHPHSVYLSDASEVLKAAINVVEANERALDDPILKTRGSPAEAAARHGL